MTRQAIASVERLLGALVAVASVASIGCVAASPRPVAATYACSELPDPAASAGTFYRGGVTGARPLYRTMSRTRAFENRQLAGAELHVPAAPGMTSELLERALACHAVGGRPAHPNDPLHPRGGLDFVRVRPRDAGFAVSLHSDRRETAEEIWQRSQAFAGANAQVDVRQEPPAPAGSSLD